MEIRAIVQTFDANVRTPVHITGRYLRLLATVSPITIEIGRHGQAPAKITNIEAGLALRLRPDQDEFENIWITTTAAEQVTVLVGDGEITYDPVNKDWYDRNPIGKQLSYSAINVAPHSSTQRWTYTVPTGKKLQLQSLDMALVRVTPAAAVGRAQVYVDYTPSGGSAGGIMLRTLFKNAVGDEVSGTFGGTATYLVGDRLRAFTEDGATGGTLDPSIYAQGIEFNA